MNFRLTPDSTIAGYAIASLGFPPRVADIDGSPRHDLLTVFLKNRSDRSRLVEGQEALVEHVELLTTAQEDRESGSGSGQPTTERFI